MPVLSFSRVAANCLHLSSLRRWRRQPLGERAAANSRERRRVCRIDRLQIIQLSRRRRSEAEPIHHLEPEGFSHQGVCGPAQFALGADRGRPRNRRGAVERALHGLSFAAAIRRAQPAHPHRASGRRRFLRNLPWRGRRLAARAHAHGLDLQHARRRRHARSPQPLCARQRLRRLPPKSRARALEGRSSRSVFRAGRPVGRRAETLEG